MEDKKTLIANITAIIQKLDAEKLERVLWYCHKIWR